MAGLGNDLDKSANFGPVVNYLGICLAHVDAAVAHGSAEVIVPPSTVDTVTVVKIHGVEDVF